MLQQSCDVKRSCAARIASPGQTLFWQGDHCDKVFELVSGVARGVVISKSGDRQVVGFFFPGDRIGQPLTTDHRYSAEAVTELLYRPVPIDHWRSIVVENCQRDSEIFRSIGQEQDAFYWRGIIISRSNAVSRMATFIRFIMDRLPRRDNVIEFAIPQIDIASYLVLTRETVCRSLRRLRELGVIAMPRHDRIEIRNPELLEALATSPDAD